MLRRSFIKTLTSGSIMLGSGLVPFDLLNEPEFLRLKILHTNDVHSRIDPFPNDGSRNSGAGGAAKRASLINKLRNDHKHTLLFDAGDIFQGTPYFNYFGGELEMKLMSKMKYDGATIGNHDFDGGIDGLAKQSAHANFPFIISNYNLEDTPMHDKHLPYKVFQKEDVKIGVFGVGIELQGLVPKELYGNTVYLNPVTQANKYADLLKNELGCHYVICLSHLGYRYSDSTISDKRLARSSRNIDLIIGGHTHTFMNEPDVEINEVGREVIINQAGWAGIMLGQIEIFFERNFKNKCVSCRNTIIK